MTSDVMQAALESCPNPWCNSRKTVDCEIRAAEAPILMPSRSSAEWAVACPVCPLQTPYFDTEVEAIAAWNTRPTAQSGEGHSGAVEVRAENIMNAVLDLPFANTAPIEWDDADWHQVRRALAALNARQSGEGERERAIDDGLVSRFRSALRFAASRSVISSADEQALLAALRATDDAGGA